MRISDWSSDVCSSDLLPVVDAKDGFLATHSLLATVLALLFASDAASEDPVGDNLESNIREAITASLHPAFRADMASRFEALRSDDLLLLICDPPLRPVAELIETSAGEASLCPVKRNDVRNFAHGRPSWR